MIDAMKKKIKKLLKVISGFTTIHDFWQLLKKLLVFGTPTILGLWRAYKKIKKPIAKHFAKEQLIDLIFAQFCIILVLLLIILFCIFCIRKKGKNDLLKFEKVVGKESIADIKFYKHYIQDILLPERNDEHQKLYDGIQTGIIEVNGEAVKKHQSQMMAQFKKGDTICAIDLTSHPERLLENSRAQYNKENENFIKSGGVIKRIFIIDEDKVKDLDNNYAVDLYRVLEMNRKYGVQIGILNASWLNATQKKDVIIYSDKSCILEGIQLSVEDSIGYSNLIFRKATINDMQKNFDFLWDYPRKPKYLANLFLQCFTKNIDTDMVYIQKDNFDSFLRILQIGEG